MTKLPAKNNLPKPYIKKKPKRDARLLLDMLTYMRPDGADEEKEFISKFLMDPLDVEQDGYGNIFTRIGTAPVLWSSHTDTVHWVGGRQKIHFDGNTGFIGLCKKTYKAAWNKKQKSFHAKWNNKQLEPEMPGCLGADDTAGVWIMVEMIRSGIEGLYVFHKAEECGGQGSRHFRHMRELTELKGINYAIAFDRAGCGDIVTSSPDCSDEFAWALAEQLNRDRDFYRPDATGVFTDTCNYDDLIPECTNVSVGYFSAHTDNECLHWPFVKRLRDIMCEGIDISKLPVKRNPEDRWARYYKWQSQQYGSYYSRNYSDSYDDSIPPWGEDKLELRLDQAIARHPGVIANMLRELGITEEDIADEIFEKTGEVIEL